METILSIKIKFWLPVFFGASLLVFLLVGLGVSLQDKLNQFDLDNHKALKALVLQNALPVRRALEASKSQDIQVIIGGLSLSTDLDAIVLTDDKQSIQFSNHYAWSGKPLHQFIPESRMIDLSQINHVLLKDTAYGIIAALEIDYTLPVNGERSSRQSILWIEMNTERGKAAIVQRSLRMALWDVLAIAIFIFVLFYILYRYLGLPMIRLTRYVNNIASGDYTTQLQVKGKGEVADLVNNIEVMKHNIQSTIVNLKQSEQRLSITLDSIGDAVMVTDAQGIVMRLNVRAQELTGWSQGDALGRPVIEIFRIINAHTREPAEHPVGRVLREGIVVGLANHTTLISKNGAEYQIADSAAPIYDEDNTLLGVIMVFQDVTKRYQLENELEQTVSRFKALTSSLPDPCFILNKDGVYIEVLGGAPELLAESRELLLGNNLSNFLEPDQANDVMETIAKTLSTGLSQNIEYSVNVPSGKKYFEGATSKWERDDDAVVIWLARDITRRKEAEDNLGRLAKFDQLTGLLNRSLMIDRLKQSLSRMKRNDTYGAVIFIDLDHFKDINDSLGHHQGDTLLVSISDRIRKAIRAEDIAARFGGDEFVILLEDLGDDLILASEYAELITEKLRDNCSSSIDLSGHELHVELSAGIVMFPDGSNAEELIKHADTAMYKAKESGRNRVCFFSRELQDIAENRLKIQNDLRKALELDEFRLFVQPKVNASGDWISGEVLIRWQHPDKGLLQPNAFIPIAEQSNLISGIDRWVLFHAVEKFSNIGMKLPDAFEGLSINLSEPLMMKREFTQEVKALFMKFAIDPAMFEFEITERILLSDYSGASKVIDTLRELGMHFSVDDFGTGCSSLRYLQRLSLDRLKIDKSFVDRLPAHMGDVSIVETIISMAHNLSMSLVAEGVETKAQHGFLIEKGCEEFQGYLFSRPIPWDEFFDKLQSQSE